MNIYRNYRGFTLIEMILVLGLSALLISELIAVYISGKEMFQWQHLLVRTQEEGRFIAFYLFQQIHKAQFIEGVQGKNNEAINIDHGRLLLFLDKTSYGVNALYRKAYDEKRSQIVADGITQWKISYGIACKDKKSVCNYVSASEMKKGEKVIAVEIEWEMQPLHRIWFLYVGL